MKKLSLLLLIFLFPACEHVEEVYEYPDGITKPETIVESKGCGNIFVYQFLDSLKALTVWINAKNYTLTKKSQTIEIDTSNSSMRVILEVSPNHPHSIYFNYCNDVAYLNQGVTKKYFATAGKITFSVSEDNPIKEPIWETNYYITIKLENLRLYHGMEKIEIIIDEIVFWDVRVGWLPG